MRTIEEVESDLAARRAEVEAARRAQAAEIAKQENAQRASVQIELDRAALISAQQASLAQDLDIAVDSVPAALSNKQQATVGDAKHLWTPLFRLWKSDFHKWSDNGPNPQAARDARHALGAMKLIPAVRSDDSAFGTEAAARDLPPPKLDAGGTVGDSQYLALLAAFGLPMPRERDPGVESPQEARKRLGPTPITLGMALMFTGDRDERQTAYRVQKANDARKSELDLVEERYQIARADRRVEHQRAVISQRTDIVEVIDRELANLPIGEAWWWCRQLRRMAANERPVRIATDVADIDLSVAKIFHLARAAGARLDLTPSTPSKKKK